MKEFKLLLQGRLEELERFGTLFISKLRGDALWKLYLESFQPEDDPVFRDPESTTHNCNNCKNFIRRYGSIIAVDEAGEIQSLFKIEGAEEPYASVARILDEKITSSGIDAFFVETLEMLKKLPYESCSDGQRNYQLGIPVNHKRYDEAEAALYGVVTEGEVRDFHHMSMKIHTTFIDKSGRSVEAIQGEARSVYDVLSRGLEEIPTDTLALVEDLITQGSLLDGPAHLPSLQQFRKIKEEYEALEENQESWVWKNAVNHPDRVGKFRNTLIGVLCTELAEGMELNKACENWNKRVDPVNYSKAKAPITKRQIEEAQKFAEKEGYMESFDRRHATLEDIDVTQIRHVNQPSGRVKKATVFDKVKPSKSSRHKRSKFEGVDEVPIDKFMSEILPGCTSVEVFLENRHEGNLVSMTTAQEDSKPIFKWPNPFSWTYKGNLAGKSQIKSAVKMAGGAIDGVLNFRLAWNSDGGRDNSDLDAWATEPNGNDIGFNTDRRPRRSNLSGQLDIDNTNPGGALAVENITWNDLSKMKDGVYRLWVHQYNAVRSKGFQCEIEFEGEIFSYVYDQPVSGRVVVAEVTLNAGRFSIEHKLPSTSSQKEMYGLPSQEFHKVNLVCLSPNHWGETPVGNQHYFFMLNGCSVEDKIRSFHNENLVPDLLKHRKVMEVLGATQMIEPTKDQLSGVGFNATVRDEVILRLKGNFERVVKVKF